MNHNWELFIGVLCFNYCHTLLSLSVFSLEGQCTLQLLRLICLQIIELSAGCPAESMISNSNILTYYTPSSETQVQSVGRGEKARRKFSSMGGKAPGYRLSPDHFHTVKRMLVPDWAQKMLCIIVPNRRTVSPEFFSWARTWTFIVSITACLYQRNARSQELRFNGYHKNLSHLLFSVIAKCIDQIKDKGASTCTNGITFIALIFSIILLLLQKCIGHKRNMRTTWRSKYSCFSLWISLRQSSISPSSRESKLNADSHLILQLYLIIRWGGKYCIHEGNDSTFIGGGGERCCPRDYTKWSNNALIWLATSLPLRRS